ncbi:MAG: NAD(P)H-hydrate dehydratase [Verrucomicrobiota bacterium]
MFDHQFAHPILPCSFAKTFESGLLGSEKAEWRAMSAAGLGVARAIMQDYAELRPVPDHLSVLALVGKGHNGGDALIACNEILARYPRASVSVILACEEAAMKPLALRALRQLEGRVRRESVWPEMGTEGVRGLLEALVAGESFDICLDGLLGLASEGSLREPFGSIVAAVNAFQRIELRAAVDLPTGYADRSESASFKADFTYCTGIAKEPAFDMFAPLGRVRYIDLGFFEPVAALEEDPDAYVLMPTALDPLRCFRPASVDKRKFGHLFVVGGSAFMPGALLMAVQAAVRSGVGLVTAFAPASVAATLSAQVPEAMWVAWPETANGTLNPRAMPLLLERLVNKATAVLCGPGMGQDRNTEMVAQDIVRHVEQPVLLDADALRPKIIELASKRKRGFGPVVVTPHAGEYQRMSKAAVADVSNAGLRDFCKTYRLTTILKAPLTRLCDGDSILYNTHGGPVLSRGGSGDILAGLTGGMLAQGSGSVLERLSRGLLLHAFSAELLARESGQVAVQTTQIMDYLPRVLRGS